MLLLRYILTFLLLWVVPGALFYQLLAFKGFGRIERFVVGQALGIVTTTILALLPFTLPIPFSPMTLGAWVLFCVVGTIVVRRRNRATDQTPIHTNFTTAEIVAFCAVVGVALFLRFFNLNYAQFQGDEAAVVTRTAQILVGQGQELYLHKKGPSELLIVGSTWLLSGTMSEWLARMPFAWASVLGVASIFLIGRRLGGIWVAVTAGLLMATEGYLLGFGRIVQYQNIVFMGSAAGLLCLVALRKHDKPTLIVAASTLFAGGTLAHYDAMLGFFAILVLVVGHLFSRQCQAKANTIAASIAAVGTALGTLALFYVPFFTLPGSGTVGYIQGRLGGSGSRYNHAYDMLQRTTVYDSIYLLGLVGLGLVAWLVWRGRAR